MNEITLFDVGYKHTFKTNCKNCLKPSRFYRSDTTMYVDVQKKDSIVWYPLGMIESDEIRPVFCFHCAKEIFSKDFVTTMFSVYRLGGIKGLYNLFNIEGNGC